MKKKIIAMALIACVALGAMISGCKKECNHAWAGGCGEEKRCTYCGVVGGIHGHDAVVATCESASYCFKCLEILAEPLGHDFEDGYCSRCSMSEDEYNVRYEPVVDLNDLGFGNYYGMNVWVSIGAYDLSSGYVEPLNYYEIYYDDYKQWGQIANELVYYIDSADDIQVDMFHWVDTTTFDVQSTDVITCYGDHIGAYTITERVVSGDNMLILKIFKDIKYSQSEEEWWVPVDLLDMSTYDGEKIYFKD